MSYLGVVLLCFGVLIKWFGFGFLLDGELPGFWQTLCDYFQSAAGEDYIYLFFLVLFWQCFRMYFFPLFVGGVTVRSLIIHIIVWYFFSFWGLGVKARRVSLGWVALCCVGCCKVLVGVPCGIS